eukprot:2756207-Alexandrium_andersonii.AAC.1
MSASLVGSEMCIRDSRLGCPLNEAPILHALLASMCNDPSGPGRLVSVSYTHLTLPTICSV